MQRLYLFDPARGRLEPRPVEDLRSLRGGPGWVWLDVVDPSAAEVAEIGEEFDLHPLSLEDVLDEDVFPKLDDYPHYLFVVLHGVVTGHEPRVDTVELDAFVGAEFLVTIHREAVVGVDWFVDRIHQGTHIGFDTPARMAAAIAEAGSRRYLPLLDVLDERTEALEELALVADATAIIESQALRRDVILLRRIVGPQRDVLRSLAVYETPLLDEPAQRAFSDVYDHHFRLVESLDASRALLSSVVEIYRGAIAEKTNEVMKVLTVFSAILLPLSLIAGVWGMNFADLPGSTWRWGFVGLLAAMAVVAVGLWVYFARRGFIGGPRIRELPKAVGLGLVHIGTAPLQRAAQALSWPRTSRSAEDRSPDAGRP